MKQRTKVDKLACPVEGAEKLHPELKAYVGYCLHKIGMRARGAFDQRLQKFGLVAPMFIMLKLLKLEGKMTQVELGTYMAIDKATMVRMIDGLEERKFLKRTQHAKDRRAKLLELTDAGRKVMATIEKMRAEAEAQLLAPLSAAEREQLRTLVAKVLDVP